MTLSWKTYFSQCKSRLSAIARSCYLQRVHWCSKFRESKREQEELRGRLAESEARCRQLGQANEELSQRVSELQAELARPRQLQLPLGDVPPGQQYGAGMIALCVNLAREVGVRTSVRGLKIF